MRNKKGQAAMEFIMTYGWAILAVTVVIGALVYFGVFSPTNLLPEQCQFPSELSCLGKARVHILPSGDGNLSFVLSNNVGYTIQVSTSMHATGDCTVSGNGSVNHLGGGATEALVPVVNRGQATVYLECGAQTAGRFKSDVVIRYNNSNNGIMYPITGGIQANAQ